MRNECTSARYMLQSTVLPMDHRVEVLNKGETDEFEFWSNTDGSVYLCREQTSDEWQAILHGEVVVDRVQPWVNAEFTYPVKALATKTVKELAHLLAMQEHVHVILDDGTAPVILAE